MAILRAIHHDHRALHDRIVRDETARSPDGLQAFLREDLKSWEWERGVAGQKLSGLRIISADNDRMRAGRRCFFKDVNDHWRTGIQSRHDRIFPFDEPGFRHRKGHNLPFLTEFARNRYKLLPIRAAPPLMVSSLAGEIELRGLYALEAEQHRARR